MRKTNLRYRITGGDEHAQYDSTISETDTGKTRNGGPSGNDSGVKLAGNP